jgi:hypothetical protein
MSSRLAGRRAHRGIKLAAIAAAPICIGGFAQHVMADLIGVQFYNNGAGASLSTAASPALTSTEEAGVPSDPSVGSVLQDNWNTQGAPSPGTVATGGLAASSLLDSTGSPNALSIAMNWQSGDGTGSGTHKGGVYNTIIPNTNTNPDSAGNWQVSLLGGALANNSSSAASFVQFTGVPLTGYTYSVVAYTEMYGTTVMRAEIGGSVATGGTGDPIGSGPTVPVLGEAGGFGTNPTTGTDAVYVTQQAGGGAASAQMNTAITNYKYSDQGSSLGALFVTNPIAYSSSGTVPPTAASNYVVWTNVTPDSTGTIQLTWDKYNSGITTDTNITVEGVNAVQLIATPSVPEPASLGLLALGSASLLMRKRKNIAKA